MEGVDMVLFQIYLGRFYVKYEKKELKNDSNIFFNVISIEKLKFLLQTSGRLRFLSTEVGKASGGRGLNAILAAQFGAIWSLIRWSYEHVAFETLKWRQ